MKKKKIKNLDSLDREIMRLKLRSHEIEQKLDQNLTSLKDNVASMAFNSILGSFPAKPQGFFCHLLPSRCWTMIT
jgi:hypothetical protein